MKKCMLIAAVLFGMQLGLSQVTVSDVTVPATLSKYDQELSLNGAGLREKVFIDLYVGGLYMNEKSDDAEAILEADKPLAITLDIVSEFVDQDAMVSAVEEGFENSTDRKERQKLQPKIDTFITMFNEEIVAGDQFVLFYIPEQGTKVSKNGKELGTITGVDFKKGLFGIWLGEYPADEDLKDGMLGL